MMIFLCPSVITTTPSNNKNIAGNLKNVTTSLDRTPSIAEKKRFAARLRKCRWSIYQNIRFRKGNVRKGLKYYRNLVHKFLKHFSSKLKSKEILIWNEKLAKTSEDVKASNIKPRQPKIEKEVIAHPLQKCICISTLSNYMAKVDSSLIMLAAILYLIKNDQTQTKTSERKAEPYEVPSEEIGGDDNITIAQVHQFAELVDETSRSPTEENCDEIVTAVQVDTNNPADLVDSKGDTASVATIVNILNSEKTSDGCNAISRNEQFRREAMAYYRQPTPKSLGWGPY